MNTSFSVRYGSGSAQGDIWQDYVSFGGYNVSSQGFALVEDVSTGLLSGEISGLMGAFVLSFSFFSFDKSHPFSSRCFPLPLCYPHRSPLLPIPFLPSASPFPPLPLPDSFIPPPLPGLGWQPLAASRVTPFWQNLYAASALPFPGFAVSLSRFIDVTNASSIEPGGSLTFGYLNASLYSSEINYVPIPDGAESYWVVRMDQVAVNGTNVTSWSEGNGGYVAIDTGTTLIGGPKDVVSAVYAEIDGASAATGAYTGSSFSLHLFFLRA
jgi:hypothetical protein